MHVLDRRQEPNPLAGLNLLVALAALFLLVNAPQVDDPADGILAGGPSAAVQRVMEWRPQSPPPWGDVEQAVSEDVEPPVGANADRTRGSSGDARARPQPRNFQ